MTNKKMWKKRDIIDIKLVGKDDDVATYTLAYATGKKNEYSWSATFGIDRDTLNSMQVGRLYQVRVSYDDTGTQHWVEAAPLNGPRLQSNAITKRVAAEKTDRNNQSCAGLLKAFNMSPMEDDRYGSLK